MPVVKWPYQVSSLDIIGMGNPMGLLGAAPKYIAPAAKELEAVRQFIPSYNSVSSNPISIVELLNAQKADKGLWDLISNSPAAATLAMKPVSAIIDLINKNEDTVKGYGGKFHDYLTRNPKKTAPVTSIYTGEPLL